MSAPLIAGAVLLEAVNGGSGGGEISWGLCFLGATISAVFGYISLKLLVKALKGRWFWLFGPYCLAAGLLTLILV
jgi:undecaprenyl pyrophosphate phosphatase UppP